jgi:hypothetical protein
MTVVPPPPITDFIVGEDRKATRSFREYLQKSYIGDTGNTWTPSFVSLTQVGTATFSATYYKITQGLVYYRITITPGTSTSSTGGVTYCTFPLDIKADGALLVVGGVLGVDIGIAQGSTNRLYMPTWTGVMVPVTIVGVLET